MLPDFPKVKESISDKLWSYFSSAMQFHSTGILSQVAHRPLNEGSGSTMHYNNELSHETDFKTLQTGLSITVDEIMNTPEVIYKKLEEMAKDMAFQQSKMMIEGISSISEKYGNVVQSANPVIAEDIINMIEKMFIDFDEQGKPIMPSILAGVEMTQKIQNAFKELEENEEFKKKFDQLIHKKKEEWNDRENNRKLVG